MKIDFSKISVPCNIAGTKVQIMDIKEAFADVVYQRGAGIACHALALKIYNSKGETDYEPKEIEIIKQLAQTFLTPSVMDGILNAISGK